MRYFLSSFHIHLAAKTSAFLFVGILSLIVYKGLSSVDYINRSLMLSKYLSFILLVIFISPFISIHCLLNSGQLYRLNLIFTCVTIIITSFGFAIIVPSLRSYFHNDLCFQPLEEQHIFST